ncbi:FdhF/YdeP family oxidoreductase [Spiractinospora alimapuensis]|uniref:FdhF/YdeP family oxidoreductase n=1 Tax=Spiractinospora alimapuensis TaxID=2820884 RepID=UPI001F171B6A|nr:FdhF/YdeP family oxidoreductase [Spiractinospora alimapuensis]
MTDGDAPQDNFSVGTPHSPAPGRGPGGGTPDWRPYNHPSAGWGAAKSVARVIAKSGEPVNGVRATVTMNQENGGFDCPGCAWPDDRHGLHLDICENGIKHVTWEMTRKTVGKEFFARHSVRELSEWSDHALEAAGRIAGPLSYDPETDHYVPISWESAFEMVGAELRALDSPDQATFYTSGRLSNEGSFLYNLWVREFGTNNMPDCSNMCHEASGRALTDSLGTNKGTVMLEDWDEAEALFIVGVNAASNAPRMLTSLANAHRRGASIVHINPLVELASEKTIVPHEFVSMGTFHATSTGDLNVQPLVGGDLAVLRGVAKAVLEATEANPRAVDHEFIAHHTHDFEAYRRLCAETEWRDLERVSGVSQGEMRHLADIYMRSRRTIVAWCLGITQQEHGVDTVREIVNLLLLRGNIGREGAGPCPIRGHSNVQGNRTCGVTHHPGEEFLDRLRDVCGFEPPRERGLGTVQSIEAMLRGDVKVFVGMGGNFVLAGPDTPRTFEALRNCDLTVQVSTKLNRSHLVHGKKALILPCIARSERDITAAGTQGTTVEDSMSMVHLSYGMRDPISKHLRSEEAIISGLAMATLPNSSQPWTDYGENYDAVRDTMGSVLRGFEDFNRRVRHPLGFRIAQPARERVFETPSGRAEFSLAPLPDTDPGEGRLTLSTVRSHDQWNTTIYSDTDRYRGLSNLRTAIYMHQKDMADRGLVSFDLIDVTSIAKDGSRRTVYGYRAIAYDIPQGCATGYMPELNALCALGDYSPQSEQPLTKHLIVEITPSATATRPRDEQG